jgi:hypothetical protein
MSKEVVPPTEEDENGEEEGSDWEVGDLIGFEHKYADERREYDPNACKDLISKEFGSWSLLRKIIGALAQFWAALAFMYWSLLHRDDELMNCTGYEGGRVTLVRHLCTYTYACLRGFPILAANMVLVLTIRILVQDRIYYTMLMKSRVIDFADTPIMRTFWPWVCGFSISQGLCHFVLKAVVGQVQWNVEIMALARKFVLPGSIFFAVLQHNADIENTLIPLNRIVEQDYTKDNQSCPWLAKLKVLNERVVAWDARHRDVVGDTLDSLSGQAPTIDDIVQNLLGNYDKAHRAWKRQAHRPWGFFRSMWPAAVLVDKRMARHGDTKTWLVVFAIVSTMCLLTSVFSVYILFTATSQIFEAPALMNGGSLNTEALLYDFVLAWHAILIFAFLTHTVRNMFFHAWQQLTRSVKEQCDLVLSPTASHALSAMGHSPSQDAPSNPAA